VLWKLFPQNPFPHMEEAVIVESSSAVKMYGDDLCSSSQWPMEVVNVNANRCRIEDLGLFRVAFGQPQPEI